jgi:Cu(I)/Ag(I) efflux system membrane fusion protein
MKRAAWMVIGVTAVAGALGFGWWLGRSTSPPQAQTLAAAPAPAASAQRRVLYWHDPMVPGVRFDKPGKSPFMDMPLVPVYAEADPGAGVRVEARLQQSLGLRTAAVRRGTITSSFDAVGTVQFDERLGVAVATRVAGYVERLAVRAPMERVHAGQPLVTLFAPEWLGPVNEWLALQRAGVPDDVVAAARERLRAMSIPEDLIRESERSGHAQARVTLAAPADGVVVELNVRQGAAVAAGSTLFRIAGLDRVWAVADVPESEAVRLRRGQRVVAALQADPGQAFEGELREILPQVSGSTRTLQARFEVANRAGRLVPGMLLKLRIEGPSGSGLLVPAEAVIRTGTRAVAIVRRGDGGFEPREVTLGAEAGDDVEIARGLGEGDVVVVSGQFLVDSEARLRSALDAMSAASMPSAAQGAGAVAPTAAAAAVHVAEGRVERLEPGTITISHGAIESLRWPPMTMGFERPAPDAFAEIRPGDRVRFEFTQGGAQGYRLVSMRRLGGRS